MVVVTIQGKVVVIVVVAMIVETPMVEIVLMIQGGVVVVVMVVMIVKTPMVDENPVNVITVAEQKSHICIPLGEI